MIKTFLLKIDKLLDRHTALLLSLMILVILRVPNFFDPYWYGDEAIYLTLGQSIRSGQKLYTDIVDHKTPIIYYLAAVPNQFWFRILLFGWMIVTTTLFYDISIKIFKKSVAYFGTLMFVLLTTLPYFEGHLPNGELFVMGFVITGLWLLLRSDYLKTILEPNSKINRKFVKKQFLPLFAAGILFGLGILTKVPALLDFAALITLPWFFIIHKHLKEVGSINSNKFSRGKSFIQTIISNTKRCINHTFNKKLINKVIALIWHWLPMILGMVTPILLSIIYFISVGSGADYLEFGLLYNFHYTQTWTHNFGSSLVNFLFTLPGKTLILGFLLTTITLIKSLPLKAKFFCGWYLLTLYSVLLSNRPYPHYFLQSVPALVLLIAYWLDLIARNKKSHYKELFSTTLSILFSTALTVAILITLNFGTYSTSKYYNNFYQYLTGRINQKQYYQTFNPLMEDNYEIAQFLKDQNIDRLFIWGNNAMLYALSETVPTTRFTVAFHIKDLKVYDETMEQIEQDPPKYIVVMNNAYSDFSDFYQFLSQNYIPNYSYSHMVLYKKTNVL